MKQLNHIPDKVFNAKLRSNLKNANNNLFFLEIVALKRCRVLKVNSVTGGSHFNRTDCYHVSVIIALKELKLFITLNVAKRSTKTHLIDIIFQ